MLIQPECIPCIFKMSDALLSKLALDEKNRKNLRAQIKALPALRGEAWQVTSPEVIETIMHIMTQAVDHPDPFSLEKERMNVLAERLYPRLKNRVDQDTDPINMALRISILGNSIDFMMHDQLSDIEALILDKLAAPVPPAAYLQFRQKIEQAKTLVFFCDNAGEIVFDRLLLKTLKKRFTDLAVFVVVRNVPTLNDATLKEARSVNLTDLATVLENGISGPLPGTILKRCANRIQNLVSSADLIVAKGGGNFDTLQEELPSLKTDITFLLVSKCIPYIRYFKSDLYQPLLFNVYHADNYSPV